MTNRQKPVADGRSMPALDGGRSVVDMMRDWQLSLPILDTATDEESTVHLDLGEKRLVISSGSSEVTIEVVAEKLKVSMNEGDGK